MEPTRDTHATLVDLLDRVLDKGLMLNADLIISVSGIPLLGVNLKAALAGMETMLKYGIMKEWDERTRAYAQKEEKKKGPPLVKGEDVILQMFGSHWYSKGIYRNWRTGYFYLTNKRLLLFRMEPPEVLFETTFERIKSMTIKRKKHFTGKDREELYVLLKEPEETVILHAKNTVELKTAIQKKMEAMGITLEEAPDFPQLDENAAQFLVDGEEVRHCVKLWHYLSPQGIMNATWESGYLYLTNNRLCWWNDFEGKLCFDANIETITGVAAEIRDLGGMLKRKKILTVSYKNTQGKQEALFSGDEEAVEEAEKVIKRIVIKPTENSKAKEDVETCPNCGNMEAAAKLLREGCPICGWVSPLKKTCCNAVCEGWIKTN
jgi:DNA-directed RNA polymerase subunit M/transcription elongation factor TFIIS